MSKKNKDFWSSVIGNDIAKMKYFTQLAQIAISRFTYTGLPESVDPIFMERCLFYRGKVCIFMDDVLGLLALPVAGGGEIDQYNIPQFRDIYSTNYYAERDDTNSVIIYDNVWRNSNVPFILDYANRLGECDCTIDVNIKAQKTPIFIQCDDRERLSYMNAYQKYDGNQPMIIATKQFKQDAFKVLDTNAPFIADKVQETKQNIWNEALTFLGISNVSQTKRERLISDEVMRGMGGTIANRFGFVDCRKRGFDLVNKMFGTDIKIEFQNVDEQDDSPDVDFNRGEQDYE